MANALASYAFKGYAFRAYALATSGAIAPDVVIYTTPRTVLVATSPTFTASLSGTGNVAETGGGADALADANLQVNATTGNITAIDGSGITPAGDYSFELARNSGTPFTLVVHVLSTAPGGGVNDGNIRRGNNRRGGVHGTIRWSMIR